MSYSAAVRDNSGPVITRMLRKSQIAWVMARMCESVKGPDPTVVRSTPISEAGKIINPFTIVGTRRWLILRYVIRRRVLGAASILDYFLGSFEPSRNHRDTIFKIMVRLFELSQPYFHGVCGEGSNGDPNPSTNNSTSKFAYSGRK